MDRKGKFRQILRICWAYFSVVLFLLILLCIGLWSAFETCLRFANDTLQNMFQRSRNVPFIQTEDETSNEELQTSQQSTNTPNDDTSECTSPTFSDPRMKTDEKTTDDQTKSYQVSTKDNFSNLEGLALQMVHHERNRISTEMPCRASSSTCNAINPKEVLPVNVTSPKSVLKSSAETKPLKSTRGIRRIRFQDSTLPDVCKSSPSSFISPKKPVRSSLGPKLRKLSPASYLLNFQDSPAKSSERKISITEQAPSELHAKSSQIDLSSEIASNQQFQENSLTEQSNTTITTTLSSEAADIQQIANESMGSLTDETNPAMPTLLSSETATNQQVSNVSTDSLYVESNFKAPTTLPSEAATGGEVIDEIADSSSGELNANILTSSSKITKNQQISEESADSLPENEKFNSTVLTAYEEFEESSKVEDRCFDKEKVESKSKVKADERNLLEPTSEEISTQIKEKEVEEIRYDSPVKQGTASSNEKEEYFTKSDTSDFHELPGMLKTAHDGETLQARNLHSESTVCEQSTKEPIETKQSEYTPVKESNPTVFKIAEELRKSFESEKYSKLGSEEYTVTADNEEASREIAAQTLSEVEVENLRKDFEESEGIPFIDDDVSLKKEVKSDVSETLTTVDDNVLQPEFASNQQSAEELMPSSVEEASFKKGGENVSQDMNVASDDELKLSDESTLL